MKQSRDTLVLEIHALTPRLAMPTFVRRLVVSTVNTCFLLFLLTKIICACLICFVSTVFQSVMTLVVNLSWTNLVGFFFARYLGTVSRGGFVLMMNGGTRMIQ